MNDNKHKKENQYSPHDDKKIIFEKKEKKIKVKKLGKYVVYLLASSIIVVIVTNITIGIKYDRVLNKLKQLERNNSVILDYVDIVNKVSPSIVSISDRSDKLTGDKFYSENSTGVVIDKGGNILTNYTSIKKLKTILVKLPFLTSAPLEAEVVAKDEDIDLAILKINCEVDLTPIKLAQGNSIREGQEIAIISNAIGDENISSIVPGIITAKYEKISGNNNREFSLLQVTAPINEDNIGGAICNSKGELVGFASLDITKRKNEQGFYYGIQLSELNNVINSTNIFKTILGIDEGGIIVENKEFRGYYIEELYKDGNAYKAGIRPTDIILKVDGFDVDNIQDLIFNFENKKKGDVINCTVLSNGEIKKIKVIINN